MIAFTTRPTLTRAIKSGLSRSSVYLCRLIRIVRADVFTPSTFTNLRRLPSGFLRCLDVGILVGIRDAQLFEFHRIALVDVVDAVAGYVVVENVTLLLCEAGFAHSPISTCRRPLYAGCLRYTFGRASLLWPRGPEFFPDRVRISEY